MTGESLDHKWLAGGGEMAELILATDWAATPLGPIETWPASLRTTVSLCLASNFPIDIIWGPEATQIYNAGYRVLCGDSHPRAIGESYRVTWASAWAALGEPFEMASRGETSYLENQRMFLNRNGYLEETFFTFSLSPIRDESGKVAGLFHPVTETTVAMLSERRLRALQDVAGKASNAESVAAACSLIVEALTHYSHDVPFVMIYQYDATKTQVKLLGATDINLGNTNFSEAVPLDLAPWPFRKILDASEITLIPDVIARIGSIPCADYPEPTSQAFVIPVVTSLLAPPFGFVVVGLSARLPADESYRRFIEMLGEVASKAIGSALAYEFETRKKDELAAIEKAKTEFFSNVSHEFRTPLTLMLGPLEDSLSDTDEPLLPRQRERQERINRNALRLLKLVNTLLDFSRIQAGRIDAHYRPTDLPRLTADLASIFRSAMEKAGISFKVEMEDFDEPVFIDHDMWEKIVLNLLSNAFKFTHQGAIDVRLARRGDRVCLSVRDTGTGIPAAELPNLFQRFHRIENTHGRTYEGSGIGLALIHELVKLHGGAVSVESHEEVGSTFEVTIPFGNTHLPADRLRSNVDRPRLSLIHSAFVDEVAGWLPESARPTPTDAPGVLASASFSAGAFDSAAFVTESVGLDADPLNSAPLVSGAGSKRALASAPTVRNRILIADDNADMRSYLAQLLDPLGVVEAVADGEAAILAIRRSRPDLIVSDLMMPKLDGFGLLKWLRSEAGSAGIPFVLLSAKAGEESRIEGLEQGADDYLSKPFSAKELLARATTQLKMGEARRIAEIERNRLYEFFMRAQVPMVILIGAEHRFFLANAPYKKLVGRRVIGKTVFEVFAAPERDIFIRILDEVYSTGIPFVGTNLEFRLPDANGELQDSFLDVSFQPFREISGEIKGILAIVVDATERVLARKAIEVAVSDLTEERELRERFVTTLSHDLRTPLSVVQMSGTLLQLKSHDPEMVQVIAARIIRNAKQVDAMLCDLLDANRLQAGERMQLSMRNCRLDQLFISTTNELTEIHGDRFQLRNDAGTSQGQWDANAIRRIIENLAGNAIKYGTNDAKVTIGLAAFEDEVEISVHNGGNPISPKEQEEIFQPFHRTDQASSGRNSGWGVGLTVVKDITEAHGGTVRVESDAVHGTTFFIRLPIVKVLP